MSAVGFFSGAGGDDITAEGREAIALEGHRTLRADHTAARAIVSLKMAADKIEREAMAWELAFGCETPAEALEQRSTDLVRALQELGYAAPDGPTEPAPPLYPQQRAAGMWAWGLTEELRGGLEDTREAAIAAAREQAEADCEPGATIYVCGDIEDSDPGEYVPDVDFIIEAMSEGSYYDTPEDWSGGEWPAPSLEARAELETLLEPIRAWARRHCKSWWTAVGLAEAVPPEET